MKQLWPYLLVVVATGPAGAQVIMNGVPAREFGQHALAQPLTSGVPNLIEGRELNTPSSIAFDTSVSPPIMYVADTGNNRVLAWRDPASLGVCGTSAAATCGKADMVIGQADMFSSLPQGPGVQGSALSSGFTAPTAVAVDSSGNLYVVDAGNNRILRFPAPFQGTAAPQVDLVIGQASVTAGSQPNQGQTAPSAQTLAFTLGGAYFRSAMAFDSAGNLWVADPGNNRVLRFPGPNSASNQLAAKTLQPIADIVLGQTDFTVSSLSPDASATRPDFLSNPVSLALDLNGGLYVLDGYARVLYFVPLNSSGFQTRQAASRILGIVPPGLAYPNRYSLGVPDQTPPQGIFTVGNVLYVCDTAANRVVNFDVPANWPAATSSTPSPPATGVFGQADMVSGNANRGQAQPDATTLSAPVGGAVLNGELWVVDALNHRVLAYSKGNSGGFVAASRVVGQVGFTYNSVNLIEGREVFFNSPTFPSAGVVVDATSTPPRFYVADSQNSRVLGFKDARNIQAGLPADIVIGQPDLYTAVVNYPSGSNSSPSSTSLNNPTGLAVDSSGNLLVADSGNGRVLRFPSPFSQPSGAMPAAELVLGQSTFASQNFDVGPQTMGAPFGLALFGDGSIAVSDASYNRVLIFARPKGGDFTNGQPASSVLGQPNFVSTNRSSSSTGLNSPRHLAIDSSGRLYVCDSGNDRVSVYSNARVAPNGLGAAFLLPGLQAPQGVIVSAITGEFWVADTNNQRVLHFPEFNTAIQTGQPDGQIPSNGPIAVTLDPYDNLIVAELANRVTFYFAQLAYRNAANYNTQPVAPGSLIYVARPGVDFSFTPASSSTATWPATLNGIQVLMNGDTPCPIYLITSTAVYFQVPMSAPTSGFADFQVLDTSTGQIYADSELPMGVANPGFFTLNSQGFGQAAAVNTVDGTVNGPSHPVSKDGKSYIQFYLTGQGVVPGSPPDGVPPPQPISTPVNPIILSTGCLDGVCPDSSVSFSGLASYPGVWVINFLVPNTFPAGCNNVIAVIYNNTVSNTGANGKVQVTFCTK